MAIRRNVSWGVATAQVLSQAEEPMRPQDIVDQISFNDIRDVTGETPSNTVSTALLHMLQENPPRVRRAGRGLYEWIHDEVEEEEEEIAINQPMVENYGIGWRRDLVNWTRNPNLFGSEAFGADSISISDRNGIYMLMDNREIMYVGRTTRPLGIRLSEHTRGRMGGRWNRFSWFSISLENANQSEVIEILESVIIEAIEPRLNRQAGQQMGPELIQNEDPEFVRQRREQVLREAIGNLRD